MEWRVGAGGWMIVRGLGLWGRRWRFSELAEVSKERVGLGDFSLGSIRTREKNWGRRQMRERHLCMIV